MKKEQLERLREAIGTPTKAAVAKSRYQVQHWFTRATLRLQWDVIASPLGPLYIAADAQGLSQVKFGVSQAEFLGGLDPLARTERNSLALAPVTEQLRAYFADARFQFDLPLNLGWLTPFQQSVLQAARRIPAGTVWTYGQMAQAIGRPRASRAVGQALARNPVPIVVPCHRVIASDGSLGGYGAGEGVESKRWLLQLEGAINRETDPS